jgi:membrane-bound serine protease (ClpP class)
MARLRLAVLVGMFLSAVQLPAQEAREPRQPAPRQTAIVAELDGIIHPIAAEYLDEAISEADTTGAEVVVIVLRTPGGLLDSTRSIVSRLITSRAPVAVFVGPSGARAASAGFIISMAADIAVMAPGTHIGAAHPVSGSGQPVDETTAQKAAEDVAAYVRTLADARGRNVTLAAEAVMKSRAFTETEALEASPPLIDFVARDVDELLQRLDGRSIRRFDGRTTVIRTANIVERRMQMTWRQRFLSAIAHPQLAYLFLTLGMLGLTVELWHPGAVVPGVVGGVCLLLAVFALQILPVNITGVLLIALGVGLLVLELVVPSFGVLGIGGLVSLVIGSVMMTRTVPGVTVDLSFVVAVALALAGIVVFLGRLALKVQRQSPATGVDTMIGLHGRARTPLGVGVPGQIDVRGEIWNAESAAAVATGEPVRITGVNGLTLLVEPIGASMRQGADT